MRSLFLIASMLLSAAYGIAQPNYPAAIAKFQQYYNQQQPDSIFNMFAPAMKEALPLDQTTVMSAQLYAHTGELKKVIPLSGQTEYKGVFARATLKMIIVLNRENLMQGLRFVPYVEDSSNVVVGGVHGTLTVPETGSKVPVVLLIAGSGPTDRNGNNGSGLNTNTYKMLAEALKASGIACLRYDKRGIGASSAALKDQADMRFEDMVTDATAFVQLLQKDARFSKVIIAGHSEGSLIGMIAARQTNAAGFISLAGAGESADIILKKQLQQPVMNAMLDSLKNGQMVHASQLFPTSVQPYVMSWMKYDPSAEIKKLTMPVLIIQGTTDLQVSMYDAELLKKAKQDAVLLKIDQMNHVLKQSVADRMINSATYSNPELPLKPEMVAAVIEFVLK